MNDFLFGNIGRKLQTIAKVFTWLGIILSIFWGLIIMFAGQIIPALIIIVFGCLGSWLSSLTMYAIGEIWVAVQHPGESLPNKQSAATSQSTEETAENETLPRPERLKCRSITPQDIFAPGKCAVCKNSHEDLEKCHIITDENSRSLFICPSCIEAFRNGADLP